MNKKMSVHVVVNANFSFVFYVPFRSIIRKFSFLTYLKYKMLCNLRYINISSPKSGIIQY